MKKNSLIKAMDNVYGVFSVLAASLQKDKEQKIKHSQTLVTACEKEGVQVLVNSSVVLAGKELVSRVVEPANSYVFGES